METRSAEADSALSEDAGLPTNDEDTDDNADDKADEDEINSTQNAANILPHLSDGKHNLLTLP